MEKYQQKLLVSTGTTTDQERVSNLSLVTNKSNAAYFLIADYNSLKKPGSKNSKILMNGYKKFLIKICYIQ
jgi:hypothetical protein